MLALFLFVFSAVAAPVVAIADLSNHTGDSQLDAAGPGVAGILVSRFAGSGVVDVVERDALESLLLEQQLTVDGLTEPRTAARAGVCDHPWCGRGCRAGRRARCPRPG